MVMVYHFAGWSHTEGDRFIPPRKATSKFIKAHKSMSGPIRLPNERNPG
jgi:hypothetical protein